MIRVGINALFLGTTQRSGTATYTWSLVRHLVAEPDLEIVVFTQGGVTPDDSDIAQSCTFVACPTFPKLVGRVLWEQTRLTALARRHNVDVLWSPGYVSPVVGSLPKVVTVHDLYYEKAPAVLSRLRRIYYRLMLPLSVKRSAAVIAVSESTKADLAEHVSSSIGKTTVIHQGARGELAGSVVVPDTHDYLLMVASVTANKNVGVAIEAVQELRRRGRDLTLVVVGGDPFGLLAESVEKHVAGDVVAHVQNVSDAELAGWFTTATAYVHAATYEGFGLPVLEAQSLGVPVVSSTAGPLPEVAGEGALFFDPSSPHELASAVEAVLDDPALRADLIARGAKNLERFDWSRAASETAAIFRSISPGSE